MRVIERSWIGPLSRSNRLVVQHQLAMVEILDRQKLQSLLFQHRTPVMIFPASKDDRHYKDTIVVGQTPPDELLDKRGTGINDDILSRLPPETGDDSGEVSSHDPGVLPFRLLLVVGEDDLLATIKEPRELEHILRIGRLPRRLRVDSQVALIRPPTEQDRIHRIVPVDPQVPEPFTRLLRRNVGPWILGKLAIPVKRYVHVHRTLSSQQ